MKIKLSCTKPDTVGARVIITPQDIRTAHQIARLRRKSGRREQRYPDNWLFVKNSKTHGRGIFCGKNFQKGSVLCEYFGDVIDEETANTREISYGERSSIYLFKLPNGDIIDATNNENCKARLINHRCGDTNCEALYRNGKLIIIASTNLSKGNELFIDYRINLDPTKDRIRCLCGARQCHGFLDYAPKYK